MLDILQERHSGVTTFLWDVESPPAEYIPHNQIVYAYGILYHTRKPLVVLENLASLCAEMLLLETCVSFGSEDLINLTGETMNDQTQALGGTGCRPTRVWIFKTLKDLFPFVYLTKKQPWHEEFPTDWTTPAESNGGRLSRAVFIASRLPLCNPSLSAELLDHQEQ